GRAGYRRWDRRPGRRSRSGHRGAGTRSRVREVLPRSGGAQERWGRRPRPDDLSRHRAGARRQDRLEGQTGWRVARRVHPSHGPPVPPRAGSPRKRRYTVSRPLILIVEDELVMRRVLLVALRTQGYSVAESSTGKQALAAIREHQPEAMI